jgi:hypothetical protein
MEEERLVQDQASASARSSPTMDSDETKIDIDWFKAEAQTIDCNGEDIERWHWKKILASLGS